jgi:hypothetical protein
MSNITIENTTTIDATATLIYKGMANHAGTADACKAAYFANAQGLSLDEIAKATTKLLAADPAVKASKISKAAIEQRVKAFRFIYENELKATSATIALAYTLACKATSTPEMATVLDEYRELGNKATSPQLDELIRLAIKRANATKNAANAKGNDGEEGSEESKQDNAAAAGILADNAGQVTAYIRAQATRKFEGKDAAMILKAAQELIASLAV